MMYFNFFLKFMINRIMYNNNNLQKQLDLLDKLKICNNYNIIKI